MGEKKEENVQMASQRPDQTHAVTTTGPAKNGQNLS
jgi:hypothetical protein